MRLTCNVGFVFERDEVLSRQDIAIVCAKSGGITGK